MKYKLILGGAVVVLSVLLALSWSRGNGLRDDLKAIEDSNKELESKIRDKEKEIRGLEEAVTLKDTIVKTIYIEKTETARRRAEQIDSVRLISYDSVFTALSKRYLRDNP